MLVKSGRKGIRKGQSKEEREGVKGEWQKINSLRLFSLGKEGLVCNDAWHQISERLPCGRKILVVYDFKGKN